MRRPPVVLALLVALASGLALARVPLGASVPTDLRPAPGAYLVALYTRGCADPETLERHWAALLGSGLPVAAVNPPEPGLALLAPPSGLRAYGGDALALARALKVRAYPTTLLVDGENRVRDALEGPLTPALVRASLERAGAVP